MPDVVDLMDTEEIVKKQLTMFFLIDTSGSMDGEKISIVNNTMEEALEEMREKNVGGADTDIMVAVQTFDDSITWVTKKPVPLEGYNWKRLDTGGLTFFGDACLELQKKLSKDEFLKAPHLSYAPVCIVLSDGQPNDDNWEAKVDKLHQNKWFKHAIKYAIAIGTDADKDALARFTGNSEAVITANNGAALAKLLKCVAITSSQIGSHSTGLDPGADPDQAKQQQVIDAMKDAIDPKDLNIDQGW